MITGITKIKKCSMTSVGIIDADSILYILCYGNKDIETFDNLVTMIDNYCYNIEREMDCGTYIYVLEGDGNFRYDYDENYKSGRKDKPLFYREAKDYLLNNKEILLAKNMESDDYCHILANVCIKYEIPYVLGFVDKDLKQIQGIQYNYRSRTWDNVNSYRALYSICTQLLTGDATDTKIAGLKGIGKKKALLLLDKVKEEDLLGVVLNKYMSFYNNRRVAVEKFYNSFKLLNLIDYDEDVANEFIKFLEVSNVLKIESK